MINLIRTDDGTGITAGDEVTLNGVTLTVTELEFPDPEFTGCVHMKDADGKESHCDASDLGAEWFYNGQPIKWDSEQSDREDFDSGRWTRADTESMERGPDGPYFNEAGEPL
jgi:hypothetical protein